MKNFYIAITFLCAALIAFLVLIACALTDKPEEPQAVAPEINADGLCIVTVVKAPEPEYEMYFTEADVVALARMLYSEARGCTVDNQMKCVWCVLNRVDDARFPDSIMALCPRRGSFTATAPISRCWTGYTPLRWTYLHAGQWKSRARRFSGSCRAGICGSPATAKQIISGRTIE